MFIDKKPTDAQRAVETARGINENGLYADFPVDEIYQRNPSIIEYADVSGVKNVTAGDPWYLNKPTDFVEEIITELRGQPSPFRAYGIMAFSSMALPVFGAVALFEMANYVEQVQHPELLEPQATKKAEELCYQKEQGSLLVRADEAKKSGQIFEVSGRKLVQDQQACVIQQTPNMVSSLVSEQETEIASSGVGCLLAVAGLILSLKSLFNIHGKREEQLAAATIIEGNLNLKKKLDARDRRSAPVFDHY